MEFKVSIKKWALSRMALKTLETQILWIQKYPTDPLRECRMLYQVVGTKGKEEKRRVR